MRKPVTPKIALALAFFVALTACSTQKAAPSLPSAPPKSPEEMAEIMKFAGTPGPEHGFLTPLVGVWKAHSAWRMIPEMPFEYSEAISTKEWVLNGLYLHESYVDKNPKMPFTGMGMLGFDKVLKEYSSSWFDTMNSASWHSRGTKSSDKVISFTGGGSCPMTGDYKEVSSELEIVNADKHILRMFDTTPSGERFVSMEITYSRP